MLGVRGSVMVLHIRPRQSSEDGFLNDLSSFLGYPDGSAAALLDGTHLLKYLTFPVARKRPNWRIEEPGHVVDILTTGGGEVGLVHFEDAGSSGGVSVFPRGLF